MQPIIAQNLSKTYKLGKKGHTRTAVDSLNIEVPEGVIFGFLGPNGAGKTTTIKMILDFVRPTRGSVTVYGKPTDDPNTRRMIGYLPEQPYFHKFLKPIEVLSMHAGLAGVDKRDSKKRAMACLERAGIAEYAEVPISKLSKGLTQRVGLAQAIIGDPKLLILDEPTSGLDPIGRRHVRDLLLELRNDGKTIFLSSHLLSEIENVCDIVAVMKSGTLVALGAPDAVRNNNSQIVVQTIAIDDETRDRLKFIGVCVERNRDNTLLKIDPRNIYEVMRAMEELNLPITKIETQRESLEEAFLRLAA
ncbi:MAG: ABC transporter ATP-binding protein [Armatimonadota bacterium]|nr:ABC transporter ATP-binding protein [bacterium]